MVHNSRIQIENMDHGYGRYRLLTIDFTFGENYNNINFILKRKKGDENASAFTSQETAGCGHDPGVDRPASDLLRPSPAAG